MKKVLFNCLMITSVICACFSFFSCNYFNEPIVAYFEKYTNTAAIESHTLSVTTMLDAAGNPCIGSSQDLVITFALRNPQSYTLLLTPELGSVAEENLARSCVQENRNTVRLTVTASDLFELEKNNSEKTTIDISPLIQIQESETLRAFDSYTFPLALNTPPPQVSGAVVCVDTNSNYVVCFTMPSADILKSVHTDIEHLIINNQDIALTVNANGTYTFDVPNDNLIPDATNLVYATNIDVSFVPGTNQLYYTTGISQSDSETTFSLKLRDTSGLTSEVIISSQSEKLDVPTATATVNNVANASVSNIQATPSAVNQNQNDAYGKVTLTVPNKTTNSKTYDKSGATVTYAVYTGDSYTTLYATGKSTGNSITLSLPPTGSYKIETTANKSLYVESDSAIFYATVNFNDLYVSASGDDTSGHGTKAKPFKTIAHALGMFSDYTSEKRIHLLSNIKENVDIQKNTINLQIIGTDTNNNAVMRTVTSGTESNSVFFIKNTSGSADTFNVTLKNLIITGGKKTSGNGGGVCIINGAEVTLDHVTVSGNLAFNGGGVAVESTDSLQSKLTLTNGTVIGNKNATSEPKDVDSALNNGGNVVTNKTDKTKSCAGGGIFAIGTSSITIKEGCYVSGNIAYSEDNHDFGKGELGGGIFINETATLTIGETSNNNEQVYIQYNSVGLGRGGGIAYCSDKDAGNIKNTLIRGNKAKIGGGVYVNKENASLTLEKCTIQNNTAYISNDSESPDGLGGGIYIRGLDANVRLIDSKITQNKAGLTGPGVWIMGEIDDIEEKSKLHLSGNLQIEDAIYFNSDACSPIQIDGALTGSTKIPLYGEKVAEAQRGSTIIQGNGYTLTQDDCNNFSIKDNPNLMIRLDGPNGVLSYMSTEFFVNSATGSDSNSGTTFNKPFATIQKAVTTVITANNALSTPGSKEFIIYLTGKFTDTNVNRSDNGDAFVNIASDKKLNLTIAGLQEGTLATINANRSFAIGVQARVMNIVGPTSGDDNKVTVKLNNLILKGGYVHDKNGGGVYVKGNCNLTMSECEVTDNTAALVAIFNNGFGGGVYLDSGSEFKMIGGTISNNTAANKGGGVFVSSSSIFTMTDDAKISGNTVSSAGGLGGGVFVDASSAFIMSGGTIGGDAEEDANKANSGGGVYLTTGSVCKMSGESTKISYNTANEGAGVYVSTSAYKEGVEGVKGFTMESGTIKNNKATKSGGGVFINDTGTFNMNSGTITNNTSSRSGGGVYLYSVGKFNINNDASITSDNDIYLLWASGAAYPKITILDNFTSTTDAIISINYYSENKQIITGNLSSDTPSKFSLSNPVWAITDVGTLSLIVPPPTSGTYSCSTVEDMNRIANWVNSGLKLADVTIELAQDITLDDSFITIGKTESTAFNGTFDGKNKTIKGLKPTSKNDGILFGNVYGAIKNLTVEGESKYTGIVGCLLIGGLIDNCTSKVNVTSETYYAAGIVATLEGGIVQNCINEGDITGKFDCCGGIFGSDDAVMGTSEIINCINKGIIKGCSYVGGIGGYLRSNLYNCGNTGSVTASKDYCGGIVGSCSATDSKDGVFNSYNHGEVEGLSYVGGIVGSMDIYDSSSYANVINCYNNVVVESTNASEESIGGVVGGVVTKYYIYTGPGTATISDCYFKMGIEGIGLINEKNDGQYVNTDTTVMFDDVYVLMDGSSEQLFLKLNSWTTANNSPSATYPVYDTAYKGWTFEASPVLKN